MSFIEASYKLPLSCHPERCHTEPFEGLGDEEWVQGWFKKNSLIE